MYKRVLETYGGSTDEIINKVKEAFNKSGKPIMNFSNISDSIKYDEIANKTRFKPNIHCGQRKLFMSELRFLNEETDGTGLVIYAGGCPGNHIYELSIYYPEIRFLVIDPSGFQPYITEKLKFEHNRYKRIIPKWDEDGFIDNPNYEKLRNITNDINQLTELWLGPVRLYWIKDLCTTELINKILTLVEPFKVEYYLWSDIRTGEGESGVFGIDTNKKSDSKQTILDSDIYQNLALQYIWIRDTKPKSSMVKFRAPFYLDNNETNNNEENNNIIWNQIENDDIRNAQELGMMEGYNNHEFKYPNGQIYLQPWVSKSSTEARMVIRPGTELVTFNAYEYDNKFNYYNLIERPIRKHNVGINTYGFGYCECNDCAIELDTLRNYIRKYEFYIRTRFNITHKLFTKKIICKLGLRLSLILGKNVLEFRNHGMNRY